MDQLHLSVEDPFRLNWFNPGIWLVPDRIFQSPAKIYHLTCLLIWITGHQTYNHLLFWHLTDIIASAVGCRDVSGADSQLLSLKRWSLVRDLVFLNFPMHESARNGELCCRTHVWSQSCWYTRVLISRGWRQCFSARKIHLLPWRCCPPVSDFIACIFWMALLDYSFNTLHEFWFILIKQSGSPSFLWVK